MTSGSSPVDRLRTYLGELTPSARAMLLREIERGALAGERIAGLDLVLAELRSQQRGSGHVADRLDGPDRRFFSPLEPFLVDEEIPGKLPGRVARSSLPRIWNWLCGELLPAESEAHCRDVVAALVGEDPAAADRITREFQDRAVAAIDLALRAAANDPQARQQLIAHLGRERVLDDLADIAAVLRVRETLARLAVRLPVAIKNLTDLDLSELRSLLDQPLHRRPEALPYALVLLFTRLAIPVQLLRLVTAPADTHPTEPIASSPYAFAIDLVIDELARAANRIESGLRGRRIPDVCAEIKKFHDLARGLNSVVDGAADTRWRRRLEQLRAETAAMLRSEIDGLPGRVLRLLQPRPMNAHAPAGLDSGEVAEVEATLDLFSACRIHAGEIALHEATARLACELEGDLDKAAPILLEGVRRANGQDHSFRLSQFDAALRFSGKIFGQRYAELLANAAEAAIHGVERAARA